MRSRRATILLVAALASALAHACAPRVPPGASAVDDRRHLVLEGAENFRDLGGYRTRDGRRVKWGMLYRSDELDEASSEDVALLSGLNLRLVCDFRSQDERRPDGAPWPEGHAPEIADLGIDFEPLDASALRGRILGGDLEAAECSQMLIDANRAYVTDFAAQYAELFELLSDEENLPAVLQCSHGKDRTGFGAAMILLALGVPVDTVFDDYLLTNVYRAGSTRRTIGLAFIGSLFRVQPDEIRPLLEARREYLQAALTTIDERYGSFDAYLHDGLGVSPEMLLRLRSNLLE